MGRLIDADKLKAQVEAHEIKYKFTPTDYQYGHNIGIDKAVADIDDAAEVEAIPVEWIKARMEELESAGYIAEIGALGIKAMLIQWEKKQERN